jgi:hypothetical protein
VARPCCSIATSWLQRATRNFDCPSRVSPRCPSWARAFFCLVRPALAWPAIRRMTDFMTQQVLVQAIRVQPFRCGLDLYMRAITRPGPLGGMRGHACADGIQLHVAAQLHEVSISVDMNGFESPLKNMSDEPMALVEYTRIDPVHVPHRPRQVCAPCVKDKMIVIAHQTVGQNLGIESQHRLGNNVQQRAPVFVILENKFTSIASGGHMVDRAFKFDSERPRHSPSIECAPNSSRPPCLRFTR